MRFVAPAREAVAAATFDHPAFAAIAHRRALLDGPSWPDVAMLDGLLGAPRHAHGGATLHFAPQDRALLDDGLHYERRIHERGLIATRERNWHDLFNAIAWLDDAPLKMALNARQVADIARVGPHVRTRAQYALTHFDEAGVIVVSRDAALIDAWNRHDWRALFVDARDAWRDGTITWHLFGHALREHALAPHTLLVGKSIAIVDASHGDGALDRARRLVADRIATGVLLNDPLELRPLPLSGVPGWHDGNEDPAWYDDAPCLRPKRAGRRYGDALTMT